MSRTLPRVSSRTVAWRLMLISVMACFSAPAAAAIEDGSFEDGDPVTIDNLPPWRATGTPSAVTDAASEADPRYADPFEIAALLEPTPTDGSQFARMGRAFSLDSEGGRTNAFLSQRFTATAPDITFDARLFCGGDNQAPNAQCSFGLRVFLGGTDIDLNFPVSGFDVEGFGVANPPNGPIGDASCTETPCNVGLANGGQQEFMTVSITDLPVGLDVDLRIQAGGVEPNFVGGWGWAFIDNVQNVDLPPFDPVITYRPNPVGDGGTNPLEGDIVFFDCLGTVGVPRENLDCSWTINSAELGVRTAQGTVIAVVFPNDESVIVELEVSDGVDSVSTQTTVTIDNGAPLVKALDVEVVENDSGVALCRFADPGALDGHEININLGGLEADEFDNSRFENDPSLSSGVRSVFFDASDADPGDVFNGTCTVDDDDTNGADAFTIRVISEGELRSREADDSDSTVNAPLIVAGQEVVGLLDSPDDIDVFRLTTPEGIKVGSEFVVGLSVPTDYDLILMRRSTSNDGDSALFENAPFVSLPFVSLPFVSLPFVSLPFVSLPFVSLPFVSLPFVNAPFVSLPFVSLPFVSLGDPDSQFPLPGSPFRAANFEFEDFPLSQVGFAAPDGSTISGADIALDELGSASLGALLDEDLEVATFSAQSGSRRESAFLKVSPGTEDIYAVVVSSSAAFSSEPYSLRVEASVPPTQEQLLGPACLREELVPSSPSTTTTQLLYDPPGEPRTLIVTQRERMIATHGLTGDEFDEFIADLVPYFSSPEVSARVISVPSVIYDAADINQCRVDLQNEVVDDIREIIFAAVAVNPTINNVMLLGSADIVPPRYSPDETTVGYQGLYTQDLLMEPARPIQVAFAEGNNATDAVYGDFVPLQYRGRELYIEDIPVARLVETPDEIRDAAAAYVATQGLIPVTNTITTGYDFFTDGAKETAAVLDRFSGDQNVDLISDAWTGDDLRCGYLDEDGVDPAMPQVCPVTNVRPTLAAVNFHATYNAGLSASGFAGFTAGATTASDILEAREAAMASPVGLTLSIGCHTGLTVPDGWAIPPIPGVPLDPAEDWTQQPGNWIGPWTYGIGDDLVADRGTEGIVTLVAEGLADGLSLGEALIQAKQRYALRFTEFDVHDEKSLIGLGLFGMPQARLDLPGMLEDLIPPPIPFSEPLGTGIDLELTDGPGAPSTSNSGYLVVNTVPNRGVYFAAGRSAQGMAGRPLLPTIRPIEFQEPPNGNDRIHDVVLRGGTFVDNGGVDPAFALPRHDWIDSIEEPRACVDTFSPSQLGVASSVRVGPPGSEVFKESLLVTTAQFQCTLTNQEQQNPNIPVSGTLRRFTNLSLDVQRPDNGLEGEFQPPVVTSQNLSATTSSNDVLAALDVADPSGLREIVVLIYDISGANGTVTSISTDDPVHGPLSNSTIDLSQPAPYSMTLPNAKGKQIAIQYVDNAGNVLLKSGKGQLTEPLVVDLPDGQVVDAGPDAELEALLVDAAILPGAELTFDFGDGSYATVPVFDGAPGVVLSGNDATVTVSHDYTGFDQGFAEVTVEARGDGSEGFDATELEVIAQLVPIDDLAARPKRSKVSLTWTPPDDAEEYDIYRSTNGGGFDLIVEGHVSSYATYLDGNVTTGNTYEYFVIWRDGAGEESEPSNFVEVTLTGRR